MRIRLALSMAAMGTALALVPAQATETSPIFGNAVHVTTTAPQNKSIVGKGYYADLYGYYGNYYNNYASYYGILGAYYKNYSYYYSAYTYAKDASTYYYYAYYYQYYGQ